MVEVMLVGLSAVIGSVSSLVTEASESENKANHGLKVKR